jgi:glycosyltransferase involved in cell wall biosynthesis
MKIAIDARELCGRPTGVGRYLQELLAEWSTSADARRHEWTLYAPTRPHVPEQFAPCVRILPGHGGTRWEQWTLARALAAGRPDVLFAPAYSAPLTAPCPIALAIHDVSFMARPDWFSAREGLRRRVVTSWSARRARVILTISEFSKREIVERLSQPEGRVRVIYLGTRATPVADAEAREPMVLYVGSIFARRHVDLLVDAFANLVAPVFPEARLEIVGENRLPPQARLELGLDRQPSDVRSRVRFRSYVDDTTLQDLYRRASVFAFLSEYEGFGLTPIEALASGVAPVVLDTAVAREIYGNAASYVAFGTDTRADLGRILVDLLGQPAARAALLAHRADVLSRYDWSRTAAATLAALEEAAGAR